MLIIENVYPIPLMDIIHTKMIKNREEQIFKSLFVSYSQDILKISIRNEILYHNYSDSVFMIKLLLSEYINLK